MRFNKKSRTFEGRLKKIPSDKSLRLAIVEVDCGDEGIAIFKLSITQSKLGNPEITIRTIKPLTGEFKRKTIMAVPIRKQPSEDVQPGQTTTQKK